MEMYYFKPTWHGIETFSSVFFLDLLGWDVTSSIVMKVLIDNICTILCYHNLDAMSRWTELKVIPYFSALEQTMKFNEYNLTAICHKWSGLPV